MMYTFLFYLLLLSLIHGETDVSISKKTPCSQLSKFQYQCHPPVIATDTQQPDNCQPDNSILVACSVIPGIICDELLNDTHLFELRVPNACHYNAHTSFSTALILSIFLGFLGIDRIYLGYYAVGLFKMFTMGGLFIFWLVDVVLISLQLLLPADGTQYLLTYYGPRATQLQFESHYINFTTVGGCLSADCV